MDLKAIAVFCFWTSVATSENFLFEGLAYFSTHPIDKTLCPRINPNRDVIFELFTNNNPNTSQILLLGNDYSIKSSNFNFNNPTVFLFHGFLETIQLGSPNIIRQAYLKRGGHNIILVDAKVLLAGPWYKTAASNTGAIGKYTAAFIDYLVGRGLNLKKVHLIGHSLGSHSAGVCGHYISSGRIARITGLDPALPLFQLAPLAFRLDQSDAEFVDVIHTDGGVNGFAQPIGHADFYPNGGRGIQPGCTIVEVLRTSLTPILETIFCNHWRSFIFYAESVLNPDTFKSSMAKSWADFRTQRTNGFSANMGYATSKNVRGKFYLRTKAAPPYSY